MERDGGGRGARAAALVSAPPNRCDLGSEGPGTEQGGDAGLSGLLLNCPG